MELFPRVRRRVLVILLAALVGPAAMAQAEAFATLDNDGSGYFDTVVRAGGPGHAWLQGLAGGHALAERVALAVYHPLGEDYFGGGSPREAILFAATQRQRIAPIEPRYRGRPRQKDRVMQGCTPVALGSASYLADLSYDWEWRAAGGQGGGWVLVGVEVLFLPGDVAALCPRQR